MSTAFNSFFTRDSMSRAKIWGALRNLHSRTGTLEDVDIVALDARITDIEEDKWDDLRFPAIGRNIDTSSGRIDYDYDELGIGFQDNARYTEEPIGHIIQMPHGWKQYSTIKPHIHWIQNQDETPNWLIKCRRYNNSDAVPVTWTLDAVQSNVFTYTSGSILQISRFSEIDMSTIRISGFVDLILYRDTSNASTEFSGSDSYTGTALFKELDIHYQSDARGSVEEFTK